MGPSKFIHKSKTYKNMKFEVFKVMVKRSDNKMEDFLIISSACNNAWGAGHSSQVSYRGFKFVDVEGNKIKKNATKQTKRRER